MDRSVATLMLRGLLDNTTQNIIVEELTPIAMEGVGLCLAAGADLGRDSESGNVADRPQTMLELSLHRPRAALLLLQYGAVIAPDIVTALTQLRSPGRGSGLHDAFIQLACAIASSAPELDWYTMIPGSPGAFHDAQPAALLIEEEVPGFNDALEKAQRIAGLPIGRLGQITSDHDREEALFDLVSTQPTLFHLGSRSRVEVLRILMGDAPPPAVFRECPSQSNVLLLESFLQNTPDMSVVSELLDRGSPLRAHAFMAVAVADEFAPVDEEKSRSEMLLFLMNHPRADLNELVNSDHLNPVGMRVKNGVEIPLLEYLRLVDPETTAIFQQGKIHQKTPPAPSKSGSLRF